MTEWAHMYDHFEKAFRDLEGAQRALSLSITEHDAESAQRAAASAAVAWDSLSGCFAELCDEYATACWSAAVDRAVQKGQEQ